MATRDTKVVMLRGVPLALYLKLKMRALKDGLTMHQLGLRLLSEYVAHGLRKD